MKMIVFILTFSLAIFTRIKSLDFTHYITWFLQQLKMHVYRKLNSALIKFPLNSFFLRANFS